jgi:hypothetical protein
LTQLPKSSTTVNTAGITNRLSTVAYSTSTTALFGGNAHQYGQAKVGKQLVHHLGIAQRRARQLDLKSDVASAVELAYSGRAASASFTTMCIAT